MNMIKASVLLHICIGAVFFSLVRVQAVGKDYLVDGNRRTGSSSRKSGFEAAFQGECKDYGPCQQLCFDLHDGTFECACNEGFTLFSDGYSCVENSEYEQFQKMNLSNSVEQRNRNQKRGMFKSGNWWTKNHTSEYSSNFYELKTQNMSNSTGHHKRFSHGAKTDSATTFFKRDLFRTSSNSEERHRYKRPATSSDWGNVLLKSGNMALNTMPMSESELRKHKSFTPESNRGDLLDTPVNYPTNYCKNPYCQSGKFCVSEEQKTGPLCLCPLGWKGFKCDKVQAFRFPKFKSYSYLALRMKVQEHQAFKLELEFRPELYEGMILSIVDPRDGPDESASFSLILRNGILQCKIHEETNGDAWNSEQPVILNSWNSATIVIEKKTALFRINDGPSVQKDLKEMSLKIDSEHIVYLGAYRNLSRLESGSDNIQGFQGCVRRLSINSIPYSFNSSLEGDIIGISEVEDCRPGVCNMVSCLNGGQCTAIRPDWGTCLCPLGFTGDRCGSILEIVVPAFDGTSHLQFPGLASSSLTYTEIKIVFLPYLQDGVLLYNGYRMNGSGDFLSLSLVSGYLELKFDLGTGVNQIRSLASVSLQEWHTVVITRTGRLATLKVDNQFPVSRTSPSGYSQLSLPLNLYVGGASNFKEISERAQINSSFVGCVQKLVINGRSVKLVEQALSGANIKNCQHACVQKPCHHGGTCEPNFESYSCHCPVGYTGPACSTEIVDMVTKPMFFGNSYLHYVNDAILNRFRGQSLHFSMTFRALSPFGLVLWAGSREVITSSDYLVVGLHNGYIRLEYNLGSGPITLLYNYSRVDDGLWHTMKITRFKQRGSISVDGRIPVTAISPGPLKELNIRSELYLGGMPDIIHQSAKTYSTGLVGCLCNFTLDMEYHVQFLTMAVTGINIQPSEDIAPSDYYLFRSMAHGLAQQRFQSYVDTKNWIDGWIASKDDLFFRRGIRMLPERWEKVVASDGQYFEQ